MLNPKHTALYLAIGAMAFAAGEASAGCKYISGTYTCATWIKGSEVCDIDSSGPYEIISATCSVTGVDFVDGAEGASGTTGAYCASGELPPGLCEPYAPLIAASSSSTGKTSSAKKAPEKNKPKKDKECKPKPKHHGKHDDKKVGHDDSCADLIVPGGDPYLSANAAPPDCTETSPGNFECTTSAEIFPPEGSTCSNGQPAADFTASAMLAIAEVCVDDGYGTCSKIYEYCTVDPSAPDGTPYACVDITEQGERCSYSGGFLTYDPDDPLCGTSRTCID